MSGERQVYPHLRGRHEILTHILWQFVQFNARWRERLNLVLPVVAGLMFAIMESSLKAAALIGCATGLLAGCFSVGEQPTTGHVEIKIDTSQEPSDVVAQDVILQANTSCLVLQTRGLNGLPRQRLCVAHGMLGSASAARLPPGAFAIVAAGTRLPDQCSPTVAGSGEIPPPGEVVAVDCVEVTVAVGDNPGVLLRPVSAGGDGGTLDGG